MLIYLEKIYPGKFIHDKKVQIEDSQCTPFNRRADFQFILNDHIIIIEVDENQHKWYDPLDEKERLMEICESAGLNLVCIRFNPDKYKVNRIKLNPHIEKRYPILKETIDKVIDQIKNGDGYNNWLTEIKLFYDNISIEKVEETVQINQNVVQVAKEVIIRGEKVTLLNMSSPKLIENPNVVKKRTPFARRRLMNITEMTKKKKVNIH
uniref:Endonuclease n=1 Tax=Pithovirus LCPAC401 TaxID=2506595 RepID=A0A481ZC38_9VIRU|nr:MAG: endonuclease [Pithovirus LCPAC401]